MIKYILKSVTLITLIAFISTSVQWPAFAQTVSSLPWMSTPGTMVSTSPNFEPALIKGITVHQDNPFLFDFIVDPGQSHLSADALKQESDRMIKYFFASLTLPDKDIWVNLSPYEKDRMVPEQLGETLMGRDLLAQDYMLKQLTASLIYPQKSLGKEFWRRVYEEASKRFGSTNIPVNTFNKVWIIPQSAGIYEHGQTAFIVEGHLKVMLEEDYLSLKKHNAINSVIARSPQGDEAISERTTNDTHAIGSQVIRQIILPEIEREVNDGKNFATLRQIFYAQVLAVWFKRNLKQALLSRVYANKGTVKGIDQNDTATNEAIYQRYIKAYKKGVFNFIQQDIDPITQEALPRKYFSGGYDGAQLADMAILAEPLTDVDKATISNDVDFAVLALDRKRADAAMQNMGEQDRLNRLVPLMLIKDGNKNQAMNTTIPSRKQILAQIRVFIKEIKNVKRLRTFSEQDTLESLLGDPDEARENQNLIALNRKIAVFYQVPFADNFDFQSVGQVIDSVHWILDSETRIKVMQEAVKAGEARVDTRSNAELTPEMTLITQLVRKGHILQTTREVQTVTLDEIEEAIVSVLPVTFREEKKKDSVTVYVRSETLLTSEGLTSDTLRQLLYDIVNTNVRMDEDSRGFSFVFKNSAMISFKKMTVVILPLALIGLYVSQNFTHKPESKPFHTIRLSTEDSPRLARYGQRIEVHQDGDNTIKFSIPRIRGEVITIFAPYAEDLQILQKSSQDAYGGASALYTVRDGIVQGSSDPLLPSSDSTSDSTYWEVNAIGEGNLDGIQVRQGPSVTINKHDELNHSNGGDQAMIDQGQKTFFMSLMSMHEEKIAFGVRGFKVVGTKGQLRGAINDIKAEMTRNHRFGGFFSNQLMVLLYHGENGTIGYNLLKVLERLKYVQLKPVPGLQEYGQAVDDPEDWQASFNAVLDDLSEAIKDFDGTPVPRGKFPYLLVSLHVVLIIIALAAIIITISFVGAVSKADNILKEEQRIQERQRDPTLGEPPMSIYLDGPRRARIEWPELNPGDDIAIEANFPISSFIAGHEDLPESPITGLKAIKAVFKDGIPHFIVPKGIDKNANVVRLMVPAGTVLSSYYAQPANPVVLLAAHKKSSGRNDRASIAAFPGGIDLSQQESALHIEKDPNGGVKVDIDPALIAQVEREGLKEVVPVIIGEHPANPQVLFGAYQNPS